MIISHTLIGWCDGTQRVIDGVSLGFLFPSKMSFRTSGLASRPGPERRIRMTFGSSYTYFVICILDEMSWFQLAYFCSSVDGRFASLEGQRAFGISLRLQTYWSGPRHERGWFIRNIRQFSRRKNFKPGFLLDLDEESCLCFGSLL